MAAVGRRLGSPWEKDKEGGLDSRGSLYPFPQGLALSQVMDHAWIMHGLWHEGSAEIGPC